MGCSSAKGQAKSQRNATPLRRRLTVGVLEAEDCGTDADYGGTEEDRSLLLQLNKQQLLDMINTDKAVGRKFSVGSETDKSLNRQQSFGSKAMTVRGEDIDLSRETIGFSCKKGLKPEAPNQDSFFICKVEGQFSIYGVFDGHGRKGHDISNFVKDHLPKLLVATEDILEDPVSSLTAAFDRTQKLIEQATKQGKIDANRSGTTASVILHDHKKNVLWIAHVGDSRCVLAKLDTDPSTGKKAWQAVDLTEDHKPNLPAEKARIEKQGGQVIFDGGYNYRVYAKNKRYPGLNMSRAMGDLVGFYDAGISAMPDICEHRVKDAETDEDDQHSISPYSPKHQNGEAKAAALMGAVSGPPKEDPPVAKRQPSKGSQGSRASAQPSLSSHSIDPLSDKFILLCSDGVWEFVSSKEAVQAVGEFRQEQAMQASEHLAQLSWDRWMHYMRGEVVDDITSVVVHLTLENCT